ncbi:MAG: DUF6597 domain-containing transcriptional factor [Gemmatimonadaceae bacterium]
MELVPQTLVVVYDSALALATSCTNAHYELMSDALLYREFPVPPPLRSYVRCLWRMSGDAGAGPPEPIIPDGCAELIINLGNAFIHHLASGSYHQPRWLVAGQITRAITIAPSGHVELWGVRFQPWGAAPLLDFAGVEMQDRLTSLDSVTNSLDRDLVAVADCESESTQHDTLISVLTRHVAGARRVDSRMPRLMALASSRAESFTVRGLAGEAGLSIRRVQGLFRDDVGLSPKQLHRIVRFQRALALRRQHPRRTWSGIASSAGYYDQAHLIHDAHGIAGCTPAELVSGEARDLTDAFLSG